MTMMIADRIAKKIADKGFQAFLVGGAVRDIQLGRTPKDFDLATDAKPEDILRIFPHGKHVGAAFPVVIVDGIEVATFRTEIARGRHDVDITMVETIEEDLARRDFTMNAMAMGGGGLVDPFRGMDDIQMKRVKFVGPAKDRVFEDPLRMLRAVRFATRLGFDIHPDHMMFMRSNRTPELLAKVSPERIRMELEQIIAGPNPAAGIKMLRKLRFLPFVLPELVGTIDVGQNRHHAESVWDHMIGALEGAATMRTSFEVRMAALLHDVGKPAAKRWSDEKEDWTFHGHEVIGAKIARVIMERLKFDAKTTDKVVWLVERHMFFFTEETRDSRLVKLMGEAEDMGLDIRDLMRLRLADRKGNLAKAKRAKITRAFKKTIGKIRKLEREDAALKVTDLQISGHDLIELGFKPGPVFKEILEAVFNEVAELRLEDTLEAETKFVIETFGGGL